jgi:hypothetical protein
VDGHKTRTCVVVTDCGNASYRPREEDICIPNPPLPTCNDGIENQHETGVDCGGPCGPCAPPIVEAPAQPAPQPEQPAPTVPETPPVAPEKTPSVIIGLIAVISGLFLALLVGTFIAARIVNQEVDEVKRFVMKATKAGQSEQEIRKKLHENKWRIPIVNRAFYSAQLETGAEYVKKRLADGAKAADVEAGLVLSGWNPKDAHKVMTLQKK